MADPDPEISGGPGLKKYFFWPQFGLKIRGQGQGQAPWAPPLDLPLKGVAQGGGNLNCPMLELLPVKGLF